MRMSDWISDVCSSDLLGYCESRGGRQQAGDAGIYEYLLPAGVKHCRRQRAAQTRAQWKTAEQQGYGAGAAFRPDTLRRKRNHSDKSAAQANARHEAQRGEMLEGFSSEAHTSEHTSLMRHP